MALFIRWRGTVGNYGLTHARRNDYRFHCNELMKLKHTLLPAFTALFCACSAAAQEQPPVTTTTPSADADSLRFDGVRKEIYKTVGEVKLPIYIFAPPDHKPTDRRPAIIFFFGGGWTSGTPRQFEPQCRYLASRGMVAMTADYRVFSRHGTLAVKCVEDAKSAIRWVRANASRLGVDPKRIAAGGGSAGGHIAACAGGHQGFRRAGRGCVCEFRS